MDPAKLEACKKLYLLHVAQATMKKTYEGVSALFDDQRKTVTLYTDMNIEYLEKLSNLVCSSYIVRNDSIQAYFDDGTRAFIYFDTREVTYYPVVDPNPITVSLSVVQ